MRVCITSANLIIYSLDDGKSKEVCVCVCVGGNGGYIGKFLLSFIFLRGESERRINQCCALVRNTSPYADGARKTDATYSIN